MVTIIDRTRVRTLEIGRVIVTKQAAGNIIQEPCTAGETIGGHRMVYMTGGKIYKASHTETAQMGKIIGMTAAASVLNETVLVQRMGALTFAGWGLTPETFYFLGMDGEITATKPLTGFLLVVGFAKDANTLEINIQLPIKL